MGTEAGSPTTRRVAAATLVGLLAVGLLPALAAAATPSPDQGSAVTHARAEVPMKTVRARLDKIAEAGDRKALRRGARICWEHRFAGDARRAPRERSIVTVDADRRTIRHVNRDVGPGRYEHGYGLGAATSSYAVAVCPVDGRRDVVQDGVGSWSRVGRSWVVRRGLSLVDRPDARWVASPRASTDVRRELRHQRGPRHLRWYLSGAEIGRMTESRTATGTRVVIEHRSATASDGGIEMDASLLEGTLVLELDRSGALRSARGTRTSPKAPSLTLDVDYGGQRVIPPRASRTVELATLEPGCEAARVAQSVRRYPKLRARLLNRNDRTVTVARVRAAITRSLFGVTYRDTIEVEDVPRGVRVTGTHALMSRPVVRRVLAVDGRAVVRKGR